MIKNTVGFLKEFSLPLIFGVVMAILFANINEEAYRELLLTPLFFNHAPLMILGHEMDLQFIFNDIFMVFFFGIAAVEITQSVLPGGSLNPISRALNPLFGTLGGVLGPAVTYLSLCYLLNMPKNVWGGWGIPTATDIALAWLFARLIFGKHHPAVSFLLLLAVADDGIGLIIIAIFYPDPSAPVNIIFLLITGGAMALAYLFRRLKVMSFWPYILICGSISWTGLLMAHLHPALGLVFVIPFMPKDKSSTGQIGELFEDEEGQHGPLVTFEHSFKTFVDFGLLGFGITNAGVAFSQVGEMTLIVFLSLLIGKTFGVFSFSYLADRFGLKLPEGMNFRTLFTTGIVAGLGLTVALFVAGQAFAKPEDADIQSAAKMGAIFSAGIGVIAFVVSRLLGIKKIDSLPEHTPT